MFLKRPQLKGRPSKVPSTIEVILHPPPLDWIKFNTDDTAFGALRLAGCA